MSKLRNYRSKRNFDKTKEPKGRIRKQGERLLFVIQEHHASHIHFDLRLEWKGVLLSWAIPKNISMDPSVKRLAIQTEDHPYDYAHFEGHIAQGEYGAGEMVIWDKGEWIPDKEDVESSLHEGKLNFTLKGQRVFGRFKMFKTHYKKEQSWLISRVDSFDPWPGFISPMLASRSEHASPELIYLHELKYDGYRLQAHINAQDITLWTRMGKDWTDRLPLLATQLKLLQVNSIILDGELVSYDELGHTHLSYLLDNLKYRRFDLIHFVAFDIMYLDGVDLRKLPLMERKLVLDDLTLPAQLEKSLYFFEDGPGFFQAAKSLNLEGILSKNIESSYQSMRSADWIKVKTFSEEVLVIIGFTKNINRLKTLYLGRFNGHVYEYAGKVSSGLDQKTRNILEIKLFNAKAHPPFVKETGEEVFWVQPEYSCEVSYLETSGHVLRGASFKRLILGINEFQAVRKTSTERMVYEVEGLSKNDVLEFYENFSPMMFEHLQKRRLNLLRCPKGSTQNCFYQKHWHQAKIDGLKEDNDSFFLTKSAAIVHLAQFNTLEFHINGSQHPSFSLPNEIILDLDPDTALKWDQVVKGALAVKHLLSEINLVSFVKLSGGKGVHIHIPIIPKYSWEQVKGFIQTLCYELKNLYPKLFTLEMSLAARQDKIFLDYLRNSDGASYIAPYSLRAKKISSVALPLEWNELMDLGPRVSLAQAQKIIYSRTQDPWQDYFNLSQKISLLENPE